jgi:hypothetical protein
MNMSKTLMIVLGVLGVGVAFLLVVGIYFVCTMNGETRLRNTITAKQTDNTSEFDNMWKKIQQSAQVTEGQKDALIAIFNGYASARSESMKGGAGLAKWITESCPNVDTKTFTNLQNIITSARDSWTQRQKELIDLNREHDNIITLFPSSLVCTILGREKIKIVVVTSTRTDESFKTGKDDDTTLFNKKAEK